MSFVEIFHSDLFGWLCNDDLFLFSERENSARKTCHFSSTKRNSNRRKTFVVSCRISISMIVVSFVASKLDFNRRTTNSPRNWKLCPTVENICQKKTSTFNESFLRAERKNKSTVGALSRCFSSRGGGFCFSCRDRDLHFSSSIRNSTVFFFCLGDFMRQSMVAPSLSIGSDYQKVDVACFSLSHWIFLPSFAIFISDRDFSSSRMFSCAFVVSSRAEQVGFRRSRIASADWGLNSMNHFSSETNCRNCFLRSSSFDNEADWRFSSRLRSSN